MEINPYAIEHRSSLDYLIYTANNLNPRSIRIATDSIEMAKSVVRRLPISIERVFVHSEEIRQRIFDDFGLSTILFNPSSGVCADLVLFPFSSLPLSRCYGENYVVGAALNALSYKSLLAPGKLRETAGQVLTRFQPDYQVKPAASLYSPAFVFYLSLAKLFEKWNSPLYFQLETFAMSRLVSFGWMWRFGYIVIFHGELKQPKASPFL